MKIAFVVRNLSVGGIENLILKICEQLSNYHKVVIVCTDGNGEWDTRAAAVGAELKVFNMWNCDTVLDYIFVLSEFINNGHFDVIYYNDTQLGVSISPMINFEIKQIVVLHAIDPYSIEKALISQRSIDGYIAVSPKIESILLNCGMSNVKLIPNGIKILPLKKNSRDNKITFIYCGRISHLEKGVLLLPELISKFSGYEILLKIVGTGPDTDGLLDKLNKSNLTGKYSYLGVLGETDVRNEMGKSDFLLFPSFSEGFGLSIVEAQSVGCIPVAFQIDGVTDFVIQHDINGVLCEYKNIEDMHDKIDKLLQDKDKLRNMKLNAIENARQFTIDRTAQQWLSFVMTLTKKNESDLEHKARINYTIENISISKVDSVAKFRKQIARYFLKSNRKCDIQPCLTGKVLIFGTLFNSYLIYTYLKSQRVSLLGFIDNNSSSKFICDLPVIREDEISSFINCDSVIITVESDSKYLIKERIKKSYPYLKVRLWDEFLM